MLSRANWGTLLHCASGSKQLELPLLWRSGPNTKQIEHRGGDQKHAQYLHLRQLNKLTRNGRYDAC
jgi:hypothetical protein